MDEHNVEQIVEKFLKKNGYNIANKISSNDFANILLNLDTIDEERLHDLLISDWDDPYLHGFIEDLFDIIYEYGVRSKNNVEAYRHYLNVQKVIGKGLQGVVSSGNFKTKDKSNAPIFAIKNTGDEGTKSDLKREFVIARELNFFNDPVFTRVYSFFPCSNVLENDNQVISFCQTNNEYSIGFQLLYGTPLYKAKLTTEQFEKVFIIIASALYKASEKGFSHNDLHGGNILVRKLREPMLVKINIPELNIEYVETEYFPFILDYGLSRIDTSDGPIFPHGYEDNYINDRYIPLYDVYKFLLFSLYLDNNLRIEHLLQFFIPGIDASNSKGVLREMKKDNEYFDLPTKFHNYKLRDYIKNVANRLEKYAYTDDIRKYYIVGDYQKNDLFEHFGLLKSAKAENTFEDKVIDVFVIRSYSLTKEIVEVERSLDSLSSKIKIVNDDTFESKYYKYTDKLRSLSDHSERIIYKVEMSSMTKEKKIEIKNNLYAKLNKIGGQLKPLDRIFSELITAGDVPDLRSSIYMKRLFD